MEYEEKFCAFIDILGFKKLIEKGFDEAVKFYESYMTSFKAMTEANKNIYNQINQVLAKKNDDDLEYYIFSDSIIVISKNWNVFCQHIANTCSWMLENGFLFRGGIGFGKIYNQCKFPDVKMVSEGLVQAVTIEGNDSIYPRIVLSKNALKEILKNVTDIFQIHQLFVQCEDNNWCVNPFFLSPNIEPIVNWVNEKIELYKGKPFVNKYEWLGEYINYFAYWSSMSLMNDNYFFKSHVDDIVVEKMICKTSYSSCLKFKFIYPKAYMRKRVDLKIYSQSFEENAKYIDSLKIDC